jgi:hypothetical protein
MIVAPGFPNSASREERDQRNRRRQCARMLSTTLSACLISAGCIRAAILSRPAAAPVLPPRAARLYQM